LIGRGGKTRLEHHRAKEAGVKVDEAEGKWDEAREVFSMRLRKFGYV
jgi:hypothetical protein